MKITKAWYVGILVLVLVSCQSKTGDNFPGEEEPTLQLVVDLQGSATPVPMETTKPIPTLNPTATPIVILDPEPIQIDFQTADGAWLSGKYYPADVNPAPLIVLMHWARGDQSEWIEVAAWLQGRGLFDPAPDYNHSWKSSVWFPGDDLNKSIGVFTLPLGRQSPQTLRSV